MNIYPAIDLKGGHCVRLSQGRFEEVTTYSEDPVKMAKRWQAEGAQWLHIVDLDGARMGQPNTQNLEVLRQILRQVGLPVQFGGGVRSAEIVERLLRLGVTRAVVGTAAARDANLAEGLFTVYGEKVAVGVDARDGKVAVQGWEQSTGEDATAFVARMEALGAKRFIFTDIARDGMLQGVNMASLAQVAATVPQAAIIASGGVATQADIESLLQLRAEGAPNLDGVIIGKALYAGTVHLPEVLRIASH
ncbi:MAG TPA: 1-(5-phosphoribosyl)-5-[(5-phosphoribosylamino)methylideneamino]imidazole-4-carboxamide isomerase [Chthonomonadaceae bacterium]|nr:1-(5-phosphoribosyl)-5-[(5-phosphoribosylamino)methylideneamino]imidazole-4-carboxamide isomerase [Chthonomonadaceae bacterium]